MKKAKAQPLIPIEENPQSSIFNSPAEASHAKEGPQSSIAPVPTGDPAIDTHVERARNYHQGTLRSFNDQMGYAFLAGIEFLTLKSIVKHGEFEKLCAAQLPDVPKRSRCQYMKFTDTLISKSATVALLAKEPHLLPSGEASEADKKTICEAVHKAADGKTLTELYRDLGVIREPKQRTEVDTTKKLTDAELLQARKDQARDAAIALMGHQAAIAEEFEYLDDALKAELRDSTIELSQKLKTIIKPAHKSK